MDRKWNLQKNSIHSLIEMIKYRYRFNLLIGVMCHVMFYIWYMRSLWGININYFQNKILMIHIQPTMFRRNKMKMYFYKNI